MALTLAPGQSRRLDTGLTGENVYYTDGSNCLQWGMSMYDAISFGEIGFIGKRDGAIYPYRWVVYDIDANAWVLDRALWSAAGAEGHGYDHNATDPTTGDVYFRSYGGEGPVRVWTRATQTWGTTANLPANTKAAGGLTWWPGKGLFTNCGHGLNQLVSGSWVNRQVGPFPGSYHDAMEYNATADCLIFGGGNESGYYKCNSALSVTTIATPPFRFGSNPNTQGMICSMPGRAKILARSGNDGGGVWASYDINSDTWTNNLTQSVGSGDSPQDGLPPLTVSSNAVLAVSLESLGVIFFVQHQGVGATPAKVWIWRPN